MVEEAHSGVPMAMPCKQGGRQSHPQESGGRDQKFQDTSLRQNGTVCTHPIPPWISYVPTCHYGTSCLPDKMALTKQPSHPSQDVLSTYSHLKLRENGENSYGFTLRFQPRLLMISGVPMAIPGPAMQAGWTTVPSLSYRGWRSAAQNTFAFSFHLPRILERSQEHDKVSYHGACYG